MNTSSNFISYKTKDINQAAFLWCQDNVELHSLEAETAGGTTILFCFDLQMNSETLQKLLLDYANCKTLVEPTKFVHKQSTLRDLLHSNLGSRRKK